MERAIDGVIAKLEADLTDRELEIRLLRRERRLLVDLDIAKSNVIANLIRGRMAQGENLHEIGRLQADVLALHTEARNGVLLPEGVSCGCLLCAPRSIITGCPMVDNGASACPACPPDNLCSLARAARAGLLHGSETWPERDEALRKLADCERAEPELIFDDSIEEGIGWAEPNTIEAVRQLDEARGRIASLEGELRGLNDKLAAVERENRAKCLELAEMAQEIRELRGVVDAAAAFVAWTEQFYVTPTTASEQFDELRKRLDALDFPDDAPRPEPEPVALPRPILDLMAALKASLEYCSPGTVVKAHTGAPGNSVDTRVERDPEP